MNFIQKYYQFQEESKKKMIDIFKDYFDPEIKICEEIFDLSLDIQDEGYGVGFLITAGDKGKDPMDIVTCLSINKRGEVGYIDHGKDMEAKAEILSRDHRVGFFIRIVANKSDEAEKIRRKIIIDEFILKIQSFFPDLWIKHNLNSDIGESFSSIICVTRF
jgi:uncharacterized protein YciU (UPF0263 family)